MPAFINNNAVNENTIPWLILSGMSNLTGSFLIFTTLFSFPSSLIATLTYTTIFRHCFGIKVTRAFMRDIQIMVLVLRVSRYWGWHWTLLFCLGSNAVFIFTCFYVPVFWGCLREIRGRVVNNEREMGWVVRQPNLKKLHGLLVRYGVLMMIVWLGSMKEGVSFVVFRVLIGVVLVFDGHIFFMDVMKNVGAEAFV